MTFLRQRERACMPLAGSIADLKTVLVIPVGALVPCVAVVGLITGITVVFERLHAHDTDALLFARLGLLLLLSYAFLSDRAASSRELAITSAHAVTHLITAALIVMAAVFATSSAALARPRAAWVGSVIAAAFVEEVVFRVLLPKRIERNLATHLSPHLSLTFAIAMSQCAFAAGHLRHTEAGQFGLTANELLRLGAAGVFLYAIIRRIGLWLAIVMHTLVNVSFVLAPTDSGVTRGHVESVMWFIGGASLASFVFAWLHRPKTMGSLLRSFGGTVH